MVQYESPILGPNHPGPRPLVSAAHPGSPSCRSRWATLAVACLPALTACLQRELAGSGVGAAEASLFLSADLSGTAIVTVTADVTASDIPTALAFDLPIANSVAAGTITLPAGSNRTIALSAYDAQGVETHSGSVTLSIQPGSNPAISLVLARLWPNEPAGFTRITENPFDAVPPIIATAASDYWFANDATLMSIISDSTAPKSSPLVAGSHFTPAGAFHDGVSATSVERDFTDGGGVNYPRLYVSVWVKHSSNWVPHPVGSKFVWFQTPASCNGRHATYATYNGPLMQVGVNQQNCEDRIMLANVGDTTYWYEAQRLGTWHRYEYLLEMNTGSQADGRLYLWVDGHLVANYSDVIWVPSAADPHEWNGFRWENTYGGAGGSNADQWEFVDHIYVSGGN